MQFCFNGITHVTVFFCTESGDYTDYSDDDYLETRRRRSRRNQKRQVNYKEDSESDGSQKSVRYGKELRRVHKRRLSTSDSEGKTNSPPFAEAGVCQRSREEISENLLSQIPYVSQKLFPSETVHWYFLMHCYSHCSKSLSPVLTSRSDFTVSGTECWNSRLGTGTTVFTTFLLRGRKALSHEPLTILFCRRKGVTSGALTVFVPAVKPRSLSCLKEL